MSMMEKSDSKILISNVVKGRLIMEYLRSHKEKEMMKNITLIISMWILTESVSGVCLQFFQNCLF